mmetsp:Transcript_77017/g.152593  ORF Transcript_77017/g.152593 Transcript_77017/m.152593 type:complete len:254 (+) Transcript_77017:536-1297(+)
MTVCWKLWFSSSTCNFTIRLCSFLGFLACFHSLRRSISQRTTSSFSHFFVNPKLIHDLTKGDYHKAIFLISRPSCSCQATPTNFSRHIIPVCIWMLYRNRSKWAKAQASGLKTPTVRPTSEFWQQIGAHESDSLLPQQPYTIKHPAILQHHTKSCNVVDRRYEASCYTAHGATRGQNRLLIRLNPLAGCSSVDWLKLSVNTPIKGSEAPLFRRGHCKGCVLHAQRLHDPFEEEVVQALSRNDLDDAANYVNAV